MRDDELRRLLSDLDPMSARVPVEPVDSPQARHRLEQIMSSTENRNTDNQNTESPNTDVVSLDARRRSRLLLTVAASVAVLGVGSVVAVTLGGDGAGTVDDPVTALALTAPGGDPMTAMCMAFDVEALRQAPMALAGTVTKIEDRTVTLDVDRWYKGGDADVVTIALPPGDVSPALVPGVDFVQGGKFLVTAYENTVNGCGFSGPATAELTKSYDEAFAG